MLTTRAAQAAEYKSLGIEGDALDCLLRETATSRHRARVAACMAAARDCYLKAISLEADEISRATQEMGAAAILYADIVGVGGKDDCQGAATERHPALASLGKGRKQASDGGAWSAAIREAAYELAPYGQFATNENKCLVFDTPHASVWVDEVIAPLRWQYAIAREGLRRAAGLLMWHPQVPFHAPPESLPAWAAVVNEIAESLSASPVPPTECTSACVAE